jgi:dTDP-4-dehydrorhamnose reductase
MKILVIGASGLVGSHVLAAAREAGHEVAGTFRGCALPGLLPLDCADSRAMDATLRAQRPAAVVYAAGWTWVDGCEDDPPRALAENAAQPEALATVCHSHGCHFTYFSTSYVFDGVRGFYRENDEPRPLNAYSRSKLEGERRVLAATNSQALIARVISVFGAEAREKNFAFQVRRAMDAGTPLSIPSDQLGNPTYAGDIGRWTVRLVEQSAHRIWHVASMLHEWTRADWARGLVAELQNLGVQARPGFELKAVPTRELKQRAARPLNASMCVDKLQVLDIEQTAFPEAVKRTFRTATPLAG